MTTFRAALALPCLPLVLLACASPSTPTPTPDPVCPQTLTTAALRPVSASSAGLSITQGLAAVVPGPVDWSAPHVAGRVLVLSGGTLSTQALGTLSGLTSQTVLPGLLRVATPAGVTDAAYAARLTARGLRVQPDYRYSALATPNDPGAPGNKGLTVSTDQGIKTVIQTYLNRVRLPQAWAFLSACGKTPAAAKTAVLDTALDTSHPDLQGRAVAAASLVPDTDIHVTEHGTATTGVLAATTNNGVGLAGVSWSGPVVTVEVLSAEGASTSVLAQGVNEALELGAKVINMSFGTVGGAASKTAADKALNAVLHSASALAVLVAAAGNTPGDGVSFPASHPDVIAVGAVGTKDSALACYSARPSATLTRTLDIVAPGGAGYGVCSGAAATDDMLLLAPGGQYVLEAGTSFSAPLVSGVAALMRAANPDLTAAQTKALLLNSVNRSGGLPLLDANAAVRAATQ